MYKLALALGASHNANTSLAYVKTGVWRSLALLVEACPSAHSSAEQWPEAKLSVIHKLEEQDWLAACDYQDLLRRPVAGCPGTPQKRVGQVPPGRRSAARQACQGVPMSAATSGSLNPLQLPSWVTSKQTQ